MQTLVERTAHWLEGGPRKSRWKVASEPEFSTNQRLIPGLFGRDSRRASVTGSKRLPAAGFFSVEKLAEKRWYRDNSPFAYLYAEGSFIS